MGWSRKARTQMPPETANVRHGRNSASSRPPKSSPLGVAGSLGRRKRSAPAITLPIQTTGCGIQDGSPSSRSSTNPQMIAPRISTGLPPLYSTPA